MAVPRAGSRSQRFFTFLSPSLPRASSVGAGRRGDFEKGNSYTLKLHARHDNQRLSSASEPPRARGMIWSISSGQGTYAWDVRQYPHRPAAAAWTRARSATPIGSAITVRAGLAGRDGLLQQGPRIAAPTAAGRPASAPGAPPVPAW